MNKKNSKLIDIACGTGRHSTYFNKKGMRVVGIDLSKNSISKAKIFENNSLIFKVHDMREVYKKDYFDIGTNLFTSFGKCLIDKKSGVLTILLKFISTLNLSL